MSLFEHPEYDGHELVTFFHDEPSGLRAITAIHSGGMGVSGGGCRIVPYINDEDAVRDVLRLSKAMTYKLALAGMPAGGAKTVVLADPRTDKSEELLRALGRAVHRLGGKYFIAEDVGTTPADMEIIAKETPYVVGRQSDTSPATGYGVFVGVRTAVEQALGRSDLDGVTVAVQGVGHVGHHLCRHLAKHGAKLRVADVNAEAVQRAVDELGATAVDGDAIYGQEVDVFSPNALGAILHDDTIPELRCKIVCGGANNQLAEDRHADVLRQRGILYAPDFVVNMGGVIGASQEAARLAGQDREYDETKAFAQTERIAEVLREVFRKAESDGTSTHAAAVTLAKAKMLPRKLKK